MLSLDLKKIWIVVLLAVVAAQFVNYQVFATALNFDVPWGNHWDWLRFGLIPLENGKLSFFRYVTMEYHPFSHSHIMTLGLLWISRNWAALNYKLEASIGTVSMFFSVALLTWHLASRWRLTTPPSAKQSALRVLALAAVCGWVLLDVRNVNPWSLVQFEHFYLLMLFGYFVLVDWALERGLDRSGWLLAGTAVIFVLGDAIGVAAIMGTLAYLAISREPGGLRQLGMLLALLALCYVASLPIVNDARPGAPVSPVQTLLYVLEHVSETATLVYRGFAQSAVSWYVLQRYFGDAWDEAQLLLGIGLGGYMLGGLYLGLRLRSASETRVPVLLILATGATIGGLVLGRIVSYGADVAHGDRFTRMFQIGLLGASLVYIRVGMRMGMRMGIGSVATAGAWRRLLLPGAIAAMLVGLFAANQYSHWRFLQQVPPAEHQRETSRDRGASRLWRKFLRRGSRLGALEVREGRLRRSPRVSQDEPAQSLLRLEVYLRGSLGGERREHLVAGIDPSSRVEPSFPLTVGHGQLRLAWLETAFVELRDQDTARILEPSSGSVPGPARVSGRVEVASVVYGGHGLPLCRDAVCVDDAGAPLGEAASYSSEL